MNQAKNIQFSLMSMMDDFGRVFFSNSKVYRAINDSQKDYCLTLLNSDLLRELNEKKLIPYTKISDFTIEGYSLVLEHENLLQTLQHEWTFSMLKDAAQLVLEVNQICNKHGYELKDAHTLNLLFRGYQPVYIDIGSICFKASSPGNWFAYEEFLGAFIIPIMFWSNSMRYIARKLLESNFHKMFTIPQQSILESGLLKLLDIRKQRYEFKLRSITLNKSEKKNKLFYFLSNKSKAVVKKISKRNTRIFTYENKNNEIIGLSGLIPLDTIPEILDSLEVPSEESMWNGYHQKYYEKDGAITYSERFKRILEIIKGINDVRTIIDLAGNEGYFTQLIANQLIIEKIILADYDENAIDNAYRSFKEQKNLNVNTVLLNFMFTPDLIGTTKRLQSDLAVALAVTHHLVLTAGFSLAAIFERLQLYSKRYVMVEFMPWGLWGVGDTTLPDLPDWYKVEWFRNEFQNYFHIILEEKLEENRILFFGEILTMT